jgi:hypothetical protein
MNRSLYFLLFNEVEIFLLPAMPGRTSLRLKSRMKNQELGRQMKPYPLCKGGVTKISQGRSRSDK